MKKKGKMKREKKRQRKGKENMEVKAEKMITITKKGRNE